MKLIKTAVVLLSIATGSNAWRELKAIEFESTDCTGGIKHVSIGTKPEFWQIKTNNESNSVYTSTVNDGIYRWYAFSEAAEDGCAGKVLGRLWGGCVSVPNKFSDRIRCLRWCSLWEHDDHSCQAIGQD